MQCASFLKTKVKRQIKLNGQFAEFTFVKNDEYFQQKVTDEVKKIKGLFHEERGYVKESVSAGARIVSKPRPMFMCIFEDADEIKKDFLCQIGRKKYRVVNKKDVQNLGAVLDFSLEEIT